MSRILTGFGFKTTAAEVAAGMDLSGKRIIVTGGASGIGLETARVLARHGADVILAVRNVETGAQAAAEISNATGNKNIHAAQLDLANQKSIRAFVAKWRGPLHVLVNNAGVMALPETRTPEGWEMQFATNHLGHFALALGLHDALAVTGNARVVVVGSSANLFSPVIFDDIHFNFRPYDPISAYAQSKTANLLFAVAAAARWRKDGIAVNALDPGAIKTNLQRHVGGRMRSPPELQKTLEQGAANSVLLAASPLLEGITGRYFANCNEAVVVDKRPETIGECMESVARYALDKTNAERLWEESLKMANQMEPRN